MPGYELRVFDGGNQSIVPNWRHHVSADDDVEAVEKMNAFAAQNLRRSENVWLWPDGAEHSIASTSGSI